MSALDELTYFCQEQEPVGALMLTGEWGCGKTYLIENDLKNKLANTHIIIRISLFGMASIEEINESVHNAYFNAFLEDKGLSKKSETLIKYKKSCPGCLYPIV